MYRYVVLGKSVDLGIKWIGMHSDSGVCVFLWIAKGQANTIVNSAWRKALAIGVSLVISQFPLIQTNTTCTCKTKTITKQTTNITHG